MLIRKEKKDSHTIVNEKRKTEKSWSLFYIYFSSSFAARFSLFNIRDIKRGNWEQQIARDGKLNIYFKNNFILLVMNVTQLNFLKGTLMQI